MTKFYTLKEAIASYRASAEKEAKYAERKTGFARLDENQVFAPGIYVIGAPSSAGKTTWTLQLLTQLADRAEPCLFVSYEMDEKALIRKLIARDLFVAKKSGEPVTRLSNSDIRRAGLKNEDVNSALNRLEEYSNLRIAKLCLKDKQLMESLKAFAKTTDRPPTIALDYLQLIPCADPKKSAREKVDSLLNELREFQTSTDSTIILISAFNRGDEQKNSASLSSFKESGAIEYTADVVWVLEPARQSDETRSAADTRERAKSVRAMCLHCLKNREGALYEVYFRYHAAFDSFEDCDAEHVFGGKILHKK